MIFINTESVASSRNEAALVTLDAGRFAIPALGPSSGRLLRQPAMPPPLNRVWLQSYVCHAHVGVFLLIMVQLVHAYVTCHTLAFKIQLIQSCHM